MSNNYFSSVDLRFSNQQSCVINVVRLRCEPVRSVLEAVRSVYRTIDFADEYQAQLGRVLWRLRCTVMFGLAPFDDEDLQLEVLYDEISDMAAGLPGARASVSLLVERMSALRQHKTNPKLEWIMQHDWSEEGPAGLFTLMAMKQSFGSGLIESHSGNKNDNLGMINSLEQLGNGEYFCLVMPGTLQYLSHGLFMKLFHRGEYRRCHVLLYEGEPLSLKRRLQLPRSSLFPNLAGSSDLIIEKTDASGDIDDPRDDRGGPELAQIFGRFGASTGDQADGWPARFVLCDTGMGFYLSENRRVRVWRPNAIEKLAFVYPMQLQEDDLVILEKGSRQSVLEQSNTDRNFSIGLDATSVWREPLRSMLLSSSPGEVANLMIASGHLDEGRTEWPNSRAAGRLGGADIVETESDLSNAVRNLQTNIVKWAEGQVYGPGDFNHLRALVYVLVESGSLQIKNSPEYAARQWFQDLEKLRAGRRAAGMNLSGEIDHLLEKSLEAQSGASDVREMLLDNGVRVSIHRLAMISDQVSSVPESLLNQPI